MNLGIEYLIRSGTIGNIVEYPITVFLIGRWVKERLVIHLDKLDDGWYVKQWKISECKKDQPLPEMIEFFTQDPFNDKRVVVPGYNIFSYLENPIPTNYNTYNNPISKNLYEKFYDEFNSSKQHLKAKKRWLWHAFTDIYYPDISEINKMLYSKLFSFTVSTYNMIMLEQQKLILDEHPKEWKIWRLWEKHLLLDEKIPGELLFSCAFDSS